MNTPAALHLPPAPSAADILGARKAANLQPTQGEAMNYWHLFLIVVGGQLSAAAIIWIIKVMVTPDPMVDLFRGK